MGAQVVPEKGWEALKGIPSEFKNIQLLGECDAAGNLLAETKKSNFLDKSTDPEQLSESLNTTENGKDTEIPGFSDPTIGGGKNTGIKGKPGRKKASDS